MEMWIDALCRTLAGWLPDEAFQTIGLFQRAFVGMLIIAPLCATVGIQIVNFRLAFFAEAVGHSAYTGIAFGYLLNLLPLAIRLDPALGMVLFGALMAVAITYYRRSSGLPSDTIVGVFSAGVVALGLFIISYLLDRQHLAKADDLNRFLLGNPLLLSRENIATLLVFFIIVIAYQYFTYNRLMFIGLNADLAQTLGVRVAWYEYSFAVLLALVVMFSIQAMGALMVTAMLIVPAAAARNVAHSAGSVFWWALIISISSGTGGLLLSVRFNTATGATVILFAMAWFVFSHVVQLARSAWRVGTSSTNKP